MKTIVTALIIGVVGVALAGCGPKPQPSTVAKPDTTINDPTVQNIIHTKVTDPRQEALREEWLSNHHINQLH